MKKMFAAMIFAVIAATIPGLVFAQTQASAPAPAVKNEVLVKTSAKGDLEVHDKIIKSIRGYVAGGDVLVAWGYPEDPGNGWLVQGSGLAEPNLVKAVKSGDWWTLPGMASTHCIVVQLKNPKAEDPYFKANMNYPRLENFYGTTPGIKHYDQGLCLFLEK